MNASELVKKNRERILKFKAILEKAKREKELRESENKQVLMLKQQRDEIQKQIKPLVKKFDEIAKKLKSFDTNLPPYKLINEKIEEFEWKLQTEVFSPKQEKTISKNIKELRKKAKEAKLLIPLRTELYELKREIKKKESEARALHSAILLHAKQSNGHHKKTIDYFKAARELRKEIAETIQKIKPTGEEEKKDNRKQLKEFKKDAQKLFEAFKKGKILSSDEIKLIHEVMD